MTFMSNRSSHSARSSTCACHCAAAHHTNLSHNLARFVTGRPLSRGHVRFRRGAHICSSGVLFVGWNVSDRSPLVSEQVSRDQVAQAVDLFIRETLLALPAEPVKKHRIRGREVDELQYFAVRQGELGQLAQELRHRTLVGTHDQGVTTLQVIDGVSGTARFSLDRGGIVPATDRVLTERFCACLQVQNFLFQHTIHFKIRDGHRRRVDNSHGRWP
mmetsp:Transcript_59154/g.157423  ORF Transcript_59154/g.157423 Transcript_59154/m.157423 type:complete len:216 (-) Transcript_59154:59-706(-)